MEKQSKLKVIDRDMIKYIIVFFMATGHLIAWIATGHEQPDGLFEQCPLWQRLFIQLSLITPVVTPVMEHVMDAFWPGPVTMICRKTYEVPYVTTGGLETVGIRMPGNADARSFIKAAGCPIAAPSANLSGKPSPTEAEHVLHDLSLKTSHSLCILHRFYSNDLASSLSHILLLFKNSTNS